MKRMLIVKLLFISLLLMYTLINLCACEFNIYLPTEQHVHSFPIAWSYYNAEYHYKQCTTCDSQIFQNHKMDNHICTVCNYDETNPDIPSYFGEGGFSASITSPYPRGYIKTEYNEETGLWTFTVTDTNPKYPITKWTWYLFGKKVSTDKEYQLETPTTDIYEIRCVIENDTKDGITDCVVTINGKTK